VTERYFTTYSGIRLPLKPVGELQADEIENRNTFFVGYFDTHERLIELQKRVYGDIELRHRYSSTKTGCCYGLISPMPMVRPMW